MAETAQARRHAGDARRTMDERRRKQTGAARRRTLHLFG
jgi:uncharacterized membrane protein